MEIGNHWILIRFATAQDRLLVYEKRPFFVNGLNFVLKPWVAFFDPYSTSIDRVDQWVRIPRLPWEFWEASTLSDLLKDVGGIIRDNQNTLLRLKGKFARICVNIDIIRPLPGSITIAREGLSLRVPLIYEGLHEVCSLCGGDSHQLDSCPNLPVSSKIEVLVERFDAQGVSYANKAPSGSSSHSSSPRPPIDTWVKVTPKKRMRAGRTSVLPHSKSLHTLPSSVLGYGTTSSPPVQPVVGPICVEPLPKGILLANIQVEGCPDASPAVNLDPLAVFPEADVDGMDEEDNVDLYLNLHKIEDIDMSTDSAKRKRCEDGEEVSSSGALP